MTCFHHTHGDAGPQADYGWAERLNQTKRDLLLAQSSQSSTDHLTFSCANTASIFVPRCGTRAPIAPVIPAVRGWLLSSNDYRSKWIPLGGTSLLPCSTGSGWLHQPDVYQRVIGCIRRMLRLKSQLQASASEYAGTSHQSTWPLLTRLKWIGCRGMMAAACVLRRPKATTALIGVLIGIFCGPASAQEIF